MLCKKTIETNNYIYNFVSMTRINKKTKEKSPMRMDLEGSMIDVWDNAKNEWIWNDDATLEFKKWFGQNVGSELDQLTREETKILLNILDTERLDAILGDSGYNQDEIGLIMAKLGDKEMKDIHQ